MRIDILTLFPDMVSGALDHSIVGRAIRSGVVDIRVHDLRHWTTDRHRTADDVPFGGGAGMVLKAEPLMQAIAAKGVETAFVTLHVGAGTFQPVRVEKIEDHHMHSEWLEVGQDVVDAVAACRERGGRVIAVGTTSVRSLESAARDGVLKPFSGDTDIFIFPGRPFHVVDALVTNFHLPESTLLMLVSAFAGYPETMAAYAAAVEQQYRFFSYGDAMFITRNPDPRGPEETP